MGLNGALVGSNQVKKVYLFPEEPSSILVGSLAIIIVGSNRLSEWFKGGEDGKR